MNVFQYEHIVITGMDPKQTSKDSESARHHVHLTLSARPTAQWAQDFNETWYQHFYMMKRHAQVSGDGIVVLCMLEELETGLKAELEKVIHSVNDRQQVATQKAHADQIKAEQADREERKNIEEAAKRFNNNS